ncbi:MAG: DeoR family transcriptional regulator [Sulfurimonadaceae bacterium]|nr:DeoR family transcriptional regulator [Sulfurimonadaceae bacterium]
MGTLGESTPFIEFMLTSILKACKDELKNENSVPINVPKNVPIKRLDKILSLVATNSSVTIDQLAQICKVSDKTIKRDINKLKEQGLLERKGSLKSGYWQLL